MCVKVCLRVCECVRGSPLEEEPGQEEQRGCSERSRRPKQGPGGRVYETR